MRPNDSSTTKIHTGANTVSRETEYARARIKSKRSEATKNNESDGRSLASQFHLASYPRT
jgi:hypothetical protein